MNLANFEGRLYVSDSYFGKKKWGNISFGNKSGYVRTESLVTRKKNSNVGAVILSFAQTGQNFLPIDPIFINGCKL